MKLNSIQKLLFISLISLLTNSNYLFSQEKGYQGDIELRFSTYVQAAEVNISTVHGYRISPYIFLGVGVGVSRFHIIGLLSSRPLGSEPIDNSTSFFDHHRIPIFSRIKAYYYRTSKRSMILICDIGATIAYRTSTSSVVASPLVSPHIGWSFAKGKKLDRSFDLTFGLRYEAALGADIRLGYSF